LNLGAGNADASIAGHKNSIRNRKRTNVTGCALLTCFASIFFLLSDPIDVSDLDEFAPTQVGTVPASSSFSIG